jgi:predicted Mrr-cat superfamily restriction endonuclease
MKKWSAKEVQRGNLEAVLNSLEQAGHTVCEIVDGSGSRTGYVVIVSFTSK